MRRTTLGATALAIGLLLAACGSDADSESTTTEAIDTTATAASGDAAGGDAAACADGKTLDEGVLTIATGEPAYPPYVIDDAPESGQGFEAAVAMAVAKEMGFEGAAVKWIRTTFEEAITPGPKSFDFNLQQYSITPERAENVTFSDPYYTSSQAILGYADSAAAGTTSADQLKDLKLGAAVGTTSLNFITDVLQPNSQPFVYNDNAGAKAALDSKQIDAIVTDLPTALYITGVEIEGTTVFGQFITTDGDKLGMVFSKDSPLVDCVNAALGALTASGELAAIETTWMSEYTEAPVISVG